MKEKIHYTVRQNFFWYFKRVRQHHPRLIGHLAILVMLEAFQAGLTVMLPTVLVNSLAQQFPLQRVAFGIFGLGTGLAVVNYLLGFVEARGEGPKINVRSMITLETQRAHIQTSYDNLEDSEFRVLYNLAQDNGLSSNGAGAEAFYTHFALFLRKFVSFMLFSITLTAVSPIIVVIVLVTTVINYVALKNVRLYREKINKPWGEVSARSHYLEQNAYEVANGKDIRLYRMDNWYEDHLKNNIAESNGWQKKLSQRKFISDGIQDLTMFGRNLVAYIYLVMGVSRGQIGLTQFTLYFSILNQLTAYLTDLTTTINDLSKASQELNDVRHFLDVAEVEKATASLSAEVESLAQARNYQFEFVNVSYTYPHSDEPTLKNINLTIEAGEKLALVGANGAGKTTLVKLLSGLITPTSGEIYLNGLNLTEIPRDFYYQLIAPVFQEPTLFAFDLGQNVALANEYDQERARQCLVQAGLGEKLAQLPEGLGTQMTTYVDLTGVDFSGGEQQKVMLARALYKDAGMLILDEPTAALDALAENELYEKYNDLTKGKTSLFISHRLASTRFCDRIIFLSEGTVTEAGTHDDLVEDGGLYAEMYEVQSHYYQKEVREDGAE